ncbi:MAG: hypothetical protein HY840_12545 [Bacteroidetes bacterium]|nr:hypothetical protein [Bacteroidota bacterium]
MKTSKSKKLILLIASFLLVAIIVFTIPACVKDNFKFDKIAKTEWNPNIAVPLVYSSLTVQDIITNGDRQGVIVVGSDNFCTLIYKGNLFSLKGTDLIQIPDQTPPSSSASLSPAQIAALSTLGTVTASYSQTVAFNSGTTKIDSVSFKSGSLDISLSSDFKFSGQITFKIPAAKKNGVSFSQTLPFTYTGTVPVTAVANYDLTGYTFDMTLGGTTNNQFVVNYDVTLTGSGTPLASDMITLSQSFSNLNFDKIFGDIGQLALSPDQDTVEISIFKRSLGTGTFTLVNPSVKVIISNSYGVPIAASLAQLDGYTPPASAYPITGSPNPLPIPSPNFFQIGQTLKDSFTLDKNNSNIVSVINNTPKNVIYKINSLSNPGGPTHSNFVIDTSRFKVDMEIDMPLYGTAKDFTLMDTLDFTIDIDIFNNNVESALFRIYNSNGFPIDVGMQAYFMDSTYKKLDSLVIPNQLILQSAVVNSAGIVVSPTQKTYDAVVSKARWENLKTSKYIILQAVAAATTNGGNTNVKIYSTYRLDVKLGLQVQFKTKI